MERLKNHLIQEAYNYIGNNRLDETTSKLYDEIMERLEDKLSEEDAEYLGGMIMEVDNNGFFEGAKTILKLLG